MIDPRGMTVKDWTAQNTPALARLGGASPVLFDDSEWQQWALSVIQDPAVARYAPPSPLPFSNWADWAVRFNQVVPL